MYIKKKNKLMPENTTTDLFKTYITSNIESSILILYIKFRLQKYGVTL